jgi:hypothetical protein
MPATDDTLTTVPRPRSAQRRHHRAQDAQRAVDVGVELPPHDVVVALLDRPAHLHAGVVDEHVDRPERFGAATAAVTLASSSTSSGTMCRSSPAAFASSSGPALRGLRRVATTRAPWRAKWSAVSRPKPLLQPVINTVSGIVVS